MESPDSGLSINEAEDVSPPPAPTNEQNNNGHANEHFVEPDLTGFKLFSRKSRRAATSSLQRYEGWEQPPKPRRGPYHAYVHDLIQAGWDNLRALDDYLNMDIEDRDLVISVLDITDDGQLKRWSDMHDGEVLHKFLEESGRVERKVRLYLAEQRGDLAAGVMEAFGGQLDLDPRFFQWSLGAANKHVLAPSELHRAPFLSIGFGVPKLSTPSRTDAEKFKAVVYVKPDAVGDGWTGIILFSSHTKVNLSSRNLTPPPPFNSPRPEPITLFPKSFREIYLDTFSYIDLAIAAKSPFYTISYLLRLNCLCWGRVITSIRDEDARINGISDTSVGHAEEIQKSLALVERAGSYGWRGAEEEGVKETQRELKENFKHLMQQTDCLWETRDKMKAIRERKEETRKTTLTNTFTYVFAPITIISGVYGMNVSQISGSTGNPNIWQFFVAVLALNVVVVLALAVSNWIHIVAKHGRKAGAREVLGFAVGNVNK